MGIGEAKRRVRARAAMMGGDAGSVSTKLEEGNVPSGNVAREEMEKPAGRENSSTVAASR